MNMLYYELFVNEFDSSTSEVKHQIRYLVRERTKEDVLYVINDIVDYLKEIAVDNLDYCIDYYQELV